MGEDTNVQVVKPQSGPQEMFLSTPADIAVYGGAAGGGKVLSINGLALTPFGFKKNCDLKVGSAINNPDGSVARIIQLHPIQTYERWVVKFHDGTETTVTGGHLWLAWRSGKRKKVQGRGLFGEQVAEVVETHTVRRWLTEAERQKAAGIRPNWPCIPVCQEQPFNVTLKKRSKLPPRLLGILLGDGSLTATSIAITSMDEDVPAYLDELGYSYSVDEGRAESKAKNYRLTGESFQFVRGELNRLGLIGTKSNTKFIPREFKLWGVEERYQLVQGLLDTDGTVEAADGKVYYSSASEVLVDDMAFVLRSLGAVATKTIKDKLFYRDSNGEKVVCKPSYQLYIKHREPRKLFTFKRRLSRLENVPKEVMYKRVVGVEISGEFEGRCITVSHPNGLYITDEFIVTHNSYALLMEPLRHSGNPQFSGVIFRKSYAQVMAEGGPWQTAMEMYTKFGAAPRVVDRAFQFRSGARVKFAYLDNDADKLEYQGSQIAFIGFDELTHFSESQFWYLMSRNRSTCGVRPYIRATTNPDPDSWVRNLIDWWIDPDTGLAIEGRSGVLRWFVKDGEDLLWFDNERRARQEYPDIAPKSFTFIKACLEDNQILMQADPGYKSSLQALSTVDRAQLLDGNWNVRAVGGTVFRPEWFEIVDTPPPGGSEVVACDLAATQGAGDWTAIIEYVKHPSGSRYITNMTRFRGDPLAVERKLLSVAASKPRGTPIYVPQDPGQAGKFQAAHLSRQLSGYNVRFSPVMGTKVERALPVSALAEAGNIKIVRGPWVKALISELREFPTGKHDDQVDALALAEERVSSARNHFALVL